ncbi:MAG: ABC transporter ATP-binding protein [Candidatus Brocadiia bacterium]
MGLHVVVTVASIVSALVNQRMVQRMSHDLRRRVHNKVATMDLSVFSQEQVGQLMTRVMDDTAGIPANLTQFGVNVIIQTCMLILGVVLLFRMNTRLALMALGALPFYAVVCWYFLPRIGRSVDEMRVRGAAFNGFIMERITNLLTIKNYAQETSEIHRFGSEVEENLACARRQNRLNVVFNVLTTLITGLAALVVLLFGFLYIRAGRMELGEVLAFNGITSQLFVPLSALVSMLAVGRNLKGLGQRIYTFLDAPNVIQDSSVGDESFDFQGDVKLDNVSLQYHEGGPFAVKNLTVHLPAKSTVCVVGPTGCGKSSLLLLLARLYDPKEGTIMLDGTDMRELPVSNVRKAVAQVFYNCPIFSGTMAENIAFGSPSIPREKIVKVADIVGLQEYIDNLPRGYETQMKDLDAAMDSENLTRLGLARALAVDPTIVTIDDTLASLSEQAYNTVRASITSALENVTVVIATSKLSICEDADQVVVMQKGTIVQQGSHEGLFSTPGVYRRMCLRQMGPAAGSVEQ